MKQNDVFFVQPEKIAESYGIEVFQDNSISKEIYGYGKIDQNKSKKIFYNPSFEETQIRFTVAHILGHFILGHFENLETVKFIETHKNFDFNATIIEDEANRFAAKLLVPKDKVEFLIFTKNMKNIKEIANILKVSETVLVYMLRYYEFL